MIVQCFHCWSLLQEVVILSLKNKIIRYIIIFKNCELILSLTMSTISTWAVLCMDFEVTSLYTHDHQFLCQLWKIWIERFLSSLLWIQITDSLLFPSMPDVSDVGAPAKGPGLPYRVPEAPPPPVRVKIEHGWDLLPCQQLGYIPVSMLQEQRGYSDHNIRRDPAKCPRSHCRHFCRRSR